ncbi:uncharacterized protein DSM5745_08243 [Aspergillus mulundensis]|uniref:Uncharacterized protein n=1 Tax=Aspergillus mulundensis TaxID=1810919 RepID=A0A3D8R9K5_9EURO|nr:hypothetical protein DSM5745_08243 [Aspergillus mulundensis]RDW70732.1 hypothetical protein DSM5745_08243 [Aspergillus mulundensis]
MREVPKRPTVNSIREWLGASITLHATEWEQTRDLLANIIYDGDFIGQNFKKESVVGSLKAAIYGRLDEFPSPLRNVYRAATDDDKDKLNEALYQLAILGKRTSKRTEDKKLARNSQLPQKALRHRGGLSTRVVSVENRVDGAYHGAISLRDLGRGEVSTAVKPQDFDHGKFTEWIKDQCHYDSARHRLFYISAHGDVIEPRSLQGWITGLDREAPLFIIDWKADHIASDATPTTTYPTYSSTRPSASGKRGYSEVCPGTTSRRKRGQMEAISGPSDLHDRDERSWVDVDHESIDASDLSNYDTHAFGWNSEAAQSNNSSPRGEPSLIDKPSLMNE